jgi:hypothetical protein
MVLASTTRKKEELGPDEMETGVGARMRPTQP